MQYKVHWTQTAEEHLDSIFFYIADDDIDSAITVTNEIKKVIRYLPDFPYMGKEGRIKNTRELKISKFPSYFVVYKIINTEIFINAVFRYSQNYT